VDVEAHDVEPHDVEEVILIARGIATAVAPDGGLLGVQADLLGAIAFALTGVTVDYRALEPLGPEQLAAVLSARDLEFRQRIVHHMVLGELVLRPIPTVVAHRVAKYAEALGVQDKFVRVARRYAQGAYGLAWKDLQRNGFVEHVEQAGGGVQAGRGGPDPFVPAAIDPELEARWVAFTDLPTGSLGRSAWEMYDGRGFELPGAPGGAPEYLAQHDFVHVLADYGTNLKGELEVFAFIGRADPDPKGFAWLATLIGLFETGYVADAGFFSGDLRERRLDSTDVHVRIADALRRGAELCDRLGTDLLEVDFHELADLPIEDARDQLGVGPKGDRARAARSPGAFDLDGMSRIQREYAATLEEGATSR
jgi:hypothetical protein